MRSKQIQEFKETEIEKIPVDWNVVELQQISKVIDSLHITPKYSSNGIPMVRATDIKYGHLNLTKTFRVNKEVYFEFTRNHRPQRGDIVMSRVGTYFVTSFVDTDEPFCMGQNTVVIHPSINPRFVYYSLNSKFVKNQIQENLVGSGGQKTISLEDIRSLLIKKPIDSMEIERIGKILYNLDNKIENLQNQNKVLEQIIQSIFKSWFVDFDGQKVFVDSEFGQIPKEWKINELPEVCLIVDCLHIIKPPEVKNDAYLLQVFNVVDLGLIDLSKKYHVSQEEYVHWTKNIEVEEGDCIISNAGRVGAIAQIPYWLKGGIGRNLTVIRPVKVTPTYLLEYLFSKLGQEQIEHQTDTATIFNTLNVRGIKKIKILVPPISTIKKFESVSRPLRLQIEINALEKEYLYKIRDSLLPKLMSGEIRV